MLVNAEMPLFLLKSIQRLFHLVNYTTPLGGSLLKQNRFCGVLSEAPGGVAAITAAQLLNCSKPVSILEVTIISFPVL